MWDIAELSELVLELEHFLLFFGHGLLRFRKGRFRETLASLAEVIQLLLASEHVDGSSSVVGKQEVNVEFIMLVATHHHPFHDLILVKIVRVGGQPDTLMSVFEFWQ